MAPHGNRRAPVVATIAFGTAELRPDPARPNGWTVYVDGVEQSYVDRDDPRHLAFPYVRRLASMLDAAAPGGVPLDVLHLGGGGLTLPRYLAATRPGSRQRVVERDPALVALVAEMLPTPPGVVVEVGDARAAVTSDQSVTGTQGTGTPDTGTPDTGTPDTGTPDTGRYDVIVVDVFDGARMPDSVAGVGFAAAAARMLRPGGLLGVNLTDLPPLAFSRIQAATLRAAFGDVCLIGGAGMLRGRRAGNVVLVAARSAGSLPVRRLSVAAARDAEPGRVLHGADLDIFVGGAYPRLETPN